MRSAGLVPICYFRWGTWGAQNMPLIHLLLYLHVLAGPLVNCCRVAVCGPLMKVCLPHCAACWHPCSTQYEGWRTDARNFTAAILGNKLDTWRDERWVDIRSAVLRSIMKQVRGEVQSKQALLTTSLLV